MSRQQLIALVILGVAVITVYALGIVMAADVLSTVKIASKEPSTGPPRQQLLPPPYPPTWTPTSTPTPRPTDTRIPTWTPAPTHTPTSTSTARPTATPKPTDTLTPAATNPPASPPPAPELPTRRPSPTPGRLVFEAEDDALVAGECTSLVWIADDARSVKLEGKDVDQQGSKEVCPKETKTYTLKVVLNTGKESKLEVEIEVFPPTPTITNTPTKTPTPTNTPTPTATPTHTPTPTDTPIPTPTPTDTPVPTETPIPTDTPAPADTPTPTDTPSADPASDPTETPTSEVGETP